MSSRNNASVTRLLAEIVSNARLLVNGKLFVIILVV